MRLLMFVDWFLPGYKAGGQISSCSNTVEALREEMDIYIITRDRDSDDTAPYPGIQADSWTDFDNRVKINYLSPAAASYSNIKKLITETAPDTIYFNSMFSFRFSILPLFVIKMMGFKNKVVLAPRGMLQDGAIRFKTFKKKSVLKLLYYSGIVKNTLFHATDETEVQDIKKNIPGKPAIKLVYDFPGLRQEPITIIQKQPGNLKCLFASRITGKKNLLYFLQLMAGTDKNIALTIAGPLEDKNYWNECLEQIERLPSNCSVDYIGSVPNRQLLNIYKEHHLFVLPTFGENFGHVIFDSFLNGRPVLISDQTPWRQLQHKKAGFDINLADKTAFSAALAYFADMDMHAMETWCTNAWMYGKAHVEKAKELKYKYKALFS